MRYASLSATFVLIHAAFAPAFAFRPATLPRHRVARPAGFATGVAKAKTATAAPPTLHLANDPYPKQDFERAVECASECGLCGDDELVRLAEVLESFEGCIGPDEEDAEQERIDRRDAADILRADAALQLRRVYLNNVNLFKERVEEASKDKEEGSLGSVMETMVRAVECASTPGLCSDYESNRLADELEAYKGCLIDEDGEQEMIDRQDVVDILRMESALQLRQVYLKNASLLKELVEEGRDS